MFPTSRSGRSVNLSRSGLERTIFRKSRISMEDLDSGDIDYAAVAKYAADHHLPQRFTVELALEAGTKITRSAIENHRRSREFVRTVFGA